MARVTVEDCIKNVDSLFDLVLLASHRAKVLNAGNEAQVPLDNDKSTVVALREIADEKISVDDVKEDIKEVIIATGTTMEGEATAHYIREIAHQLDIRVSRIAYGVPVGGDLEFVDSSTLSRALASRQSF